MTTVDVVVPVYTEEMNLPRNIPVLCDFLDRPAFSYDWRVVIGDNGSTDNTPGVSRELQARYPGKVVHFDDRRRP